MLSTMFQVNWPFRSGQEGKNRFSRWPQRWPSWISDQTLSAIFDLRHLDSYQVSGQLAFWFRKRSEKQCFQNCGLLGFPIRMILAIFDLQVTRMLSSKFLSIFPGFRRSRLLKQIVDAA